MMNTGQVDLPSLGKALTPPVAPLEVVIRKDTTLALRDHAAGGAEREVSREEMVSVIRHKQEMNADQAVVISADKSVRYEEVIRVMDVLQKQQVKKVGLLTQNK
jgi:biopolymer transport protein TolR